MCRVVMDFWEGSVRKEDMPRRHLEDAHSQPHWSHLYTCLSPAFQVLDSPTRFPVLCVGLLHHQDVPLSRDHCPGVR